MYLSNELQAIRLNRRRIRGSLVPAVAHSNGWFVEPERIDDLGVRIWSGIDLDERICHSERDLFNALPVHRLGSSNLVHFSRKSLQSVRFAIEYDPSANGEWTSWKTVTDARRWLPSALEPARTAPFVMTGMRSEQSIEMPTL